MLAKERPIHLGQRQVLAPPEGIWDHFQFFAGNRVANSRMAEMLGYENGDLVGHLARDYLFEEDQTAVASLFERWKGGKTWSMSASVAGMGAASGP